MSDKGGLHMKITFIGATHEVTGSCYYLEAAGKKFLVDCGMEQGPDYYETGIFREILLILILCC